MKIYGQSPFYDNKNPPEHTIKTPWRVIFVNLKMEKNKTLNGGILKRWSQNGENPNEVVANCDHPEEVIANCENQQLEVANCENPQEKSLSQYDIEKLIVTVRGEQVLIDQDIARIYGVTTGRLNQQAKRNIARFPESFRFQLTKEERDEVIANCDNLRSLKFYPSLPYAYTEQGIGQLSTVVHSKIAIERSIMTEVPVHCHLQLIV